MKKIIKFKIKSYSKASGKLIPFSFEKYLPLKIKRVFFLYGKKNQIRGEHAHKKCSQIFYPISGKVILRIKTPSTNQKITLSHSSKVAVLVPPKYWCGVKFIGNNSVLMVLCDKYYDFNDYLENFYDYKKYIKKK